MTKIKIDTAGEILEALGCGSDPIHFNGVEMTPDDLRYSEHSDKSANRTKIEFSALRRRWVRGTVADMVCDRLGLAHKAKKCKRSKAVRGKDRSTLEII